MAAARAELPYTFPGKSVAVCSPEKFNSLFKGCRNL